MNSMDYVYIPAGCRNGTLYIGVTNKLKRRVWEHKHDLVKGFTEKYGIHNLVYYEEYQDTEQTILREKAAEELEKILED